MQDNNNKTSEDTNNVTTHIEAAPVIAVFIHEDKCYVSTPEENTSEYYISLCALLQKVSEETPQLFADIKQYINNDFTNQVN